MTSKITIEKGVTVQTLSVSPRGSKRSSRLLRSVQELSVIPGLLVLGIIGAIISPVFLRISNITLVLQQSSELALVVVGLALIILTGRLDISLESTVGLAPMVAGMMMVSFHGWGIGLNGPTGILVTLVVGALIGLINGFLVVRLKLDSFIVTLAMLILLRGITTGLSRGQTLAGLPETYSWIGSASLLGIPVSVWISVTIIVAVGLLLKFHSWGRALYAIGGNESAARAAGIPVNRILISVFVVASVLAALAGVMLAGRLSAVTAGAGTNMIFSALAAAVIGGVALSGGQGRMLGAALGVLLLGALTNVLTLAGVSTFWIDAVYGAVIIGSLLVGKITSKNKSFSP